MMPLFDLISNAQNGKGMELLARQFNLNQQQANLALEALLPAFSEGLKRNTADPMSLSGFMQAMMSGQHAQYFENAAAAFTPSGVNAGNDVLGQLFGSKELSRAVAAQAQAATGIGQDVLKQMLPVIASMLMGGMFKQSAGQMNAAGMGMGGNPFGELIEQMMKNGMGGGATQPAPAENPFGKILEQMMGGGQAARPQGGSGGSGNPWIDMLEQVMKGAQGGASRETPQPAPQPRRRPQAAAPEEAPEERAPAGNPLEDLLGQMFDTGRSVQKDYEKGVKSIFDQYVRNMEKLR